MIGTELLAEKADAQIVLVESAAIAAIVAPVLTDQVVVVFEPEDNLNPFSGRDVICIGRDLPLVGINSVRPVRLRSCTDPMPEQFTVHWLKAHMDEVPLYTPESSGQSAESVRTGEASSSGPPSASIALSKAVPDDPPEPDLDPEIAELHVKLRETLLSMPEAEFRKAWAQMGDDEKRTVGDAGFQRFAAIELAAMYAESHVGQALNAPDADLQAVLGDSSTEDIGEPPEYLEDGPDNHLPRTNGHNGADKSSIWVAKGDDWALPHEIFGVARQPDEMDPSLLPGWMADKAQDDAQRIGGDVGGVVLSMLTSFSALIDNRYRMQVKQFDTWSEIPILWGLCLGDTSTKKNALMEAATTLLQRINQDARKAAVRQIKEYADACDEYQTRRKAWISENAKLPQGSPGKEAPIEPPPIEQPWFICEDFTSQALGMALQNQTKQKIFILGDEPSILAFDRFSGGKESAGRQDFLSLYQGRPRSILRVGTAERSGNRYIESWAASMNIGSTPSSLRQMLGPVGLMQDGLLQRCLVNTAKLAIRGEDRRPDAIAQAAYEKACHNLFALRAEGDGIFKQSPEGSAMFADFEDYIQGQTASQHYSPGHRGHIGKWAGMAPRIALTLFMACEAQRGMEPIPGRTVVGPEYMKMAIDLLTDWQGPQVRWLWDGVLSAGHEIDADLYKVCELICCWHLPEPGEQGKITQSDIGSSFKEWRKASYPTSKKISILNALQAMNWIGFNPGARQIVPGLAESYRLHPALRRMFDQHPIILNARVRRLADGAKFRAMRAENQGLQ